MSDISGDGLRFLCPNGHLGFAPLKVESFEIGVASKPDFILADSGSDDIGPGPLGGDTSAAPKQWQRHDLEKMLLAARKLRVPMIIGSAGDTGTNSRVDMYVEMVRDIAAEHQLEPFKLGYFYSEVPLAYLQERMGRGDRITGLDGREDLTEDELAATDRVVAVAGVHPYMELLERGAEVIIDGRSSDAAIFAAPAIRAGYSESNSYYLGKVLECASFNAEPYAGKESVVGKITHGDVIVTAMHPDQRCTVASVAGHAMYERSNPYFENVAGGTLDMTHCVYEQYDQKSTRVTGAQFIPSEQVRVKLEGAGKVGERYMGFVGVRDPFTVARIDEVIAWAKRQVEERFGDPETGGYQLHYQVYGRNGVMGDLEPLKHQTAHELGVMVFGVAPTAEMAEKLTLTGTRQMFYARLPNTKGTAGGVAFPLDEVTRVSPAYRWTLNHTIAVDDPLELFQLHTTEVSAEARPGRPAAQLEVAR